MIFGILLSGGCQTQIAGWNFFLENHFRRRSSIQFKSREERHAFQLLQPAGPKWIESFPALFGHDDIWNRVGMGIGGRDGKADIQRYLEAGGNFIDTAECTPAGQVRLHREVHARALESAIGSCWRPSSRSRSRAIRSRVATVGKTSADRWRVLTTVADGLHRPVLDA